MTLALMVDPSEYDVTYSINPWMQPGCGVDRDKARRQWEAIRDALIALGVQVEVLDAGEGLPDMVFAANAGMVHGDTAIISRFRYAQRRGEERLFRAWFESKGYRAFTLNDGAIWEGQACTTWLGDLLLCSVGARANSQAYREIADIWSVPDEQMRLVSLVDPYFYHLDIPFCPLDAETCLICPAAFEPGGYDWIKERLPRAIETSRQEALQFSCNAFALGEYILMHKGASSRLKRKLVSLGYRIIELDVTEFIKSGGGIKCLILRIDDPLC
jgi:N-dimethylarginine dimethylaminohydrolase